MGMDHQNDPQNLRNLDHSDIAEHHHNDLKDDPGPTVYAAFPTEVFELIIDQLDQDQVTPYNLHASTLSACALTCRSWRSRSQRFLFRYVHLQSDLSVRLFLSALTTSTAVSNGNLHTYTSHLGLSGTCQAWLAVRILAGQLPGLTHILIILDSDFNNHHVPLRDLLIGSVYTSLVSLEIRNLSHHRIRDIVYFASSFPNLSHLVLSRRPEQSVIPPSPGSSSLARPLWRDTHSQGRFKHSLPRTSLSQGPVEWALEQAVNNPLVLGFNTPTDPVVGRRFSSTASNLSSLHLIAMDNISFMLSNMLGWARMSLSLRRLWLTFGDPSLGSTARVFPAFILDKSLEEVVLENMHVLDDMDFQSVTWKGTTLNHLHFILYNPTELKDAVHFLKRIPPTIHLQKVTIQYRGEYNPEGGGSWASDLDSISVFSRLPDLSTVCSNDSYSGSIQHTWEAIDQLLSTAFPYLRAVDASMWFRDTHSYVDDMTEYLPQVSRAGILNEGDRNPGTDIYAIAIHDSLLERFGHVG